MTNKRKKEDLWRNILYSSDNKSIKELLTILRTEGNVEILPDIINIYHGYTNTELGDYIYDFLSDLKCQEATTIILSAIKNKEYNKIKTQLLTLCWRTGLDFSDYANDFIKIFLNSEIEQAFEAFTTMEYSKNIPEEKLEANIKTLQLKANEIDKNKQDLLIDLVNVLRKKLKNNI